MPWEEWAVCQVCLELLEPEQSSPVCGRRESPDGLDWPSRPSSHGSRLSSAVSLPQLPVRGFRAPEESASEAVDIYDLVGSIEWNNELIARDSTAMRQRARVREQTNKEMRARCEEAAAEERAARRQLAELKLRLKRAREAAQAELRRRSHAEHYAKVQEEKADLRNEEVNRRLRQLQPASRAELKRASLIFNAALRSRPEASKADGSDPNRNGRCLSAPPLASLAALGARRPWLPRRAALTAAIPHR